VKRSEFIEYVLYQWQDFHTLLDTQIREGFATYDSFLKRNGLNQDQFQKLIKDLKLNVT
jgi:hypothetical protein